MSTDKPHREPETALHGEESIIQGFLAPLAAGFPGAFGLKDDCAAITPTPGHDLIVKTDPVAEGIHFLADDAPEDIGWKALAVNVSDLAAKGAEPRAYLMALSFPAAPTRDWMQRFAEGLGAAQTAFGMHLIGGDTDRRPGPITISITVFGEVPTGGMLQRGAARPGDLLFVTGTLGASAMGLALRREAPLAGRWGLGQAEANAAIARYLRPQPRLTLRPALRGAARAAMDLSDGLAKDLGRMARASGVSATVDFDRLPIDAAAAKAIRAEPERWRDVVAGGDDYEVLATVAPERAGLFRALANGDGVGVTEIGRIGTGKGLAILDGSGRPLDLTRTGWDHF